MTSYTTTTRPAEAVSLQGWGVRHPLAAYFTLAYAGTWLLFLPIVLSARGLGLVPWQPPDAVSFVLFFGATYTGPLLAAMLMTAATEGRAGITRLLRRMVQWRVGWLPYLVILGYPLIFLAGLVPWVGAAPLSSLAARPALYLGVFLPNLLIGILLPGLGEETGWRGFALPRLQQQNGALLGSLILGALHAIWHLPGYLVADPMGSGVFDPNVFVGNSFAIVFSTLLWTWVFNRGRGSVLIAILVHSASNAAGALVPALVTNLPPDPWGTAKIMAGVALVVVLLTRGRLGYDKGAGEA